MNFRVKITLTIIILSLVIVFRFYFYDALTRNKADSALCRDERRAIEMEFAGLLTKKFLDGLNHMSKTLVLKNDGESYTTTFLASEQSGFFDELLVGDFLSKEKGTLTIEVARNGIAKDYDLDFMCPNIGSK